jgi:tryptophanyl-tRNA synthetase
MSKPRILSGMRPSGAMHLGHFHGALKNWVRLQHDFECYYFAADWHVLTTHYQTPEVIEGTVWDMMIDWMAAGVDPEKSVLFIQSKLPQHAELHLLLSMFTPLSWLQRIPTYKDQMQQHGDAGRDIATYGFLGYPLMQAADILMYRANYVPVGEDQVSHVEFTREVARRFNYLFGRDAGFEAKAAAILKKLAGDAARINTLRGRYLEQGDAAALEDARAIVKAASLADDDRERLYGYLQGGGKQILTECEAKLTETPRLVGLDGKQKMSKSLNNTIMLREAPESIDKKIRGMPTDPARVRRTDPGDPEKCPVWTLHKIYSDEARRNWVVEGCKSAGIGCLECKRPVIDAIVAELSPIRERAEVLAKDPAQVHGIIKRGCEKAADTASDTMATVRRAMGLAYE